MAIRPYIFTKETRFLGYLRGRRNRVSCWDLTVGANGHSPLHFHQRNPVSGLAARNKKPGFLFGFHR
ncbi:hypothetical protein [Planktothricoides sp. SR001]|uniref:hypothetical protein n=1 Tax=Planktothricoides sp. SR001 TaxID=1705388 RepID=UPI0012E225E2|nr:hypothetical protein [Planktothricoides sp. SR001]